MLDLGDGPGGRSRHRLHQARRDPGRVRQERFPSLAARGDPEQLAAARTLQDDRRCMRRSWRAVRPRLPRGPAVPSAAASAPAGAPSAQDLLADALLAVVAEKTGYPAEMLELEWISRPTSASTRSSASRSWPRTPGSFPSLSPVVPDNSRAAHAAGIVGFDARESSERFARSGLRSARVPERPGAHGGPRRSRRR